MCSLCENNAGGESAFQPACDRSLQQCSLCLTLTMQSYRNTDKKKLYEMRLEVHILRMFAFGSHLPKNTTWRLTSHDALKPPRRKLERCQAKRVISSGPGGNTLEKSK